jgi:hypothetical protein
VGGVGTVGLSFLLLATLGCGRAHFEARHFFGTWRIAERAPSSAAVGSGAAEIVLRSDGTFAATDVSADLLDSIRTLPGRLSSLTGTWTIDDRLDFDRLLLTIHEADQSVPVPYGVELMVDGSPATPALYYYLGDRGQNQRVYFTRTSTRSDTR